MVCHCKRHKPACGCLSKGFIEKLGKKQFLIDSVIESAEIKVKHFSDMREWDEGKCDFHSSKVCYCSNYIDGESFNVKERTTTLYTCLLVLSTVNP